MVIEIVQALQSLSFTQCTIIVPAFLGIVIFFMPRLRQALGIEGSQDMYDTASEGFAAVALFFVFIVAGSLSTVQGFQKDGQKATEVEFAHITNLDRELVRIGDEQADAIRVELRNYVQVIIDKEWAEMKHGAESEEVDLALGKVISLINHIKPNSKLSEKVVDDMNKHLELVSDSRDERIEVSTLHLSPIYWWMIFSFLALLIFIGFFSNSTTPKRVGLAGKMVALSFTFVLLLQTDGVFSGDICIQPTLLKKAVMQMKVRNADSATLTSQSHT